MANYANAKATIAANVYQNNNNEVTANMVKAGINAVVDTLIAGGYLYAGIAHPDDAAVTPDANVYYIASEAGTYANKGGIVVADGEVAVLKYNGSWSKEVTGAATTAQVAELGQYSENPEWLRVVTDSDGRILYGVKTDGKFYFGAGCPQQIQDYIIANFVEKEAGKSLINEEWALSQSVIDNPEWMQVTLDSDGKILEGMRKNGEKFIASDTPKSIDTIYQTLAGVTIYEIAQKSGKFGLISRLYIEGLSKNSNGRKLMVDGAQSTIAENPNYTSVEDTNHEFEFTVSADGYTEVKDKINIHKNPPANAKDEDIKLMCIGDSLTDQGYAGAVEFIFKALNQDYGEDDIKALMVGTQNDAASLQLGDYAFNVKGCNEGRSGWSIADYLRHFDCVTMGTYINAKVNWDMLGLGTMTRNGTPGRTYVAYSGTAEQKELMRTTCHGYYDADPSQELWSYLKSCWWLYGIFDSPFEYDGNTYDLGSSYSAAVDDDIVAAVKYICVSMRKPNPFYDYATVQTSDGDHAFSMSAYLDGYKTLASDGTTRLVIGSTAGTFVRYTSELNDWDVCAPTHIAIIMNENDARYTDSGSEVVSDLILCADLIKAYDNTIKIAIGSTRGYGVFNPAQYGYLGFVGKYAFVQRRFDTWQALRAIMPSTTYALLPLYVLQSPIGAGGGRAFDTLDQKERYNTLGDNLHTNENALSYLDRAYLVAAWIIDTL